MKNTECVKVVIRCRPLSSQEVGDGRKMVVQMDTRQGQVTIRNPKATDEAPKQFAFDQIFEPNTLQELLYRDTAAPIVESVLEGYNGTIFAYGQTGTGKTFTMEGKDDPPTLKGIIPRTFDHVFSRITDMGKNKQFLVSVSFLELYNEEIRDLLAKNTKKLDIREKESGVYVKDLSKFIIQNAQEMKEKLLYGRENRVVGATNMNQDSSRSHSLFMITVETNEFFDNENHIKVGRLNLVDLAGSERQSKTQATGDRFKEAININQSLTTLGNVISALIDNKSQHIPYRDSKLTRLLQDSLGGNTKTVMVANIGPADYNYDETISTLRYAHRAKQIKNKPKINEDPKDAMLRQFQDEISKLRAQLEEAATTAGGGGQSFNGGGETQVVEVQKVVKVQNQDKIRELEQRLEMEKESVHKRIEEERRRIEQQKNLAEEDKIKLLKALQEKEEAQQAARDAQQKLIKKISKMEQKVIQGQSEVQEAMMKQKELDNAMKQLEQQKLNQQQLAQELEKREEEMMKLTHKYNSQREEVEDKTKRIKQLVQRLKQIENENKELDEFCAREIEELQERRRQVSKEVKLKQLILEYFIPPKELERMQMLAMYNEDLDDWMIQGLELTGNIMKKNRKPEENDLGQAGIEVPGEVKPDLCAHPNVYFVYTDEGLVREEELAPQDKQKAQKRLQSATKPQSAKKRPSSKTARLQSAKKGDKSVIQQQAKEPENFPKAKGLVQKK